MKIRYGFVSNSSSESFTCDICGEHAEGMDLSLSECDMFRCENGHTMCLEHAIKDLTYHGKTDEEDDDDEFDIYEIDEACCPICNYQEISYADAHSFLQKEYGISDDEVFQKIKEINHRRKKLYHEEYVKDIFERYNLNDDSYLEMIKSRFPSYTNYMNYEKKV